MAETTGNPTNDPNKGDSFMDALRGAGEASLNAWSRLGDLAGEFGRNFRADREADIDTGAHHVNDDNLTVDHSGLAEQLKAAVANARKAYEGAKDDNSFRAATASFASDAESIFRDFAGSVTRAADTARESNEADETKQAFSAAAEEVRETFNNAIGQVRKSAANSDIDVEGTVTDLRSRLEDMINRVAGTFDGSAGGASGTENAEGAESHTGANAAEDTSKLKDEPGIVDGEVVDEAFDSEDGTTNN